jgi:iron complex outermembrane receptor protein
MKARNTRKHPARNLLALSIASIYLPAAPALSQGDGALVLEEIMVTARKREESVLEIPDSVANFSEAMLAKANIRSLKDIALLVPNLYMTTRLDGFPNVSMRGMGGFGNTQGVGFYLDDVQLFADQTSRFGDLERIEVLKGPQGVLYGGSNIGGAVKYISARPSTEAVSGSVQGSVGEFGYTDIEGEVNVPLSDSWAMRVFAFSESSDGFLKNPNSVRSNGERNNNDTDVGRSERQGGRISLAGDITERLSAFIALRYNELDGPNNTWSLELDSDLDYPDRIDTSFNPRHDRETSAASIELNYDMDTVTATFIGSYSDTESRRQSDLDLNQEWVLDLVRPEDFTVTTAEFRLSSNDDRPLQWQAGAYYLDVDRDLDSVLNIREGFCFLDPGVCDPALGPNDDQILAVAPFEVSARNRSQQALFANVTYRFAERWEIDLGARLDDWKSERTNLDTGISGEQSGTEFLGRASLSWFVSDSSMIYGSVSQGFEPGDLNLANFEGERSLFGYDPEEATQWELGYKGQFLDGRGAITLAAFYIDYTDRQFELQAQDDAGVVIEGIINAGDSTQYGFEADVLLKLSDAWTLSVGGGYIDAEWENGTVSPINGADISGQTPPNIADLSLTTALDYQHSLASGMLLSARMQVRYKSDASTNAQFFDAPGDAFPAWDNPAFTVVDIGGALAKGPWELRLHVENLFDEEYYIDAQEFPNFGGSATPGTPGSIIIGTLEQPRRAVLSASYAF